MEIKLSPREYFEEPLSKEDNDRLGDYIRNFKAEFGNMEQISVLADLKKLFKMVKTQKERAERYRVKRIKYNNPNVGIISIDNNNRRICKAKRELLWRLDQLNKK